MVNIMNLSIISKSALMPVSKEEIIEYLRLPSGFSDLDSEQDKILSNCISSAVCSVGNFISSGIIKDKYLWKFHYKRNYDYKLYLPIGQCTAVDSVLAYNNNNNNNNDIDRNMWTLFGGSSSYVIFHSNVHRQLIGSTHVEMTFDSGFGETISAVPADIRQAILMLASHYYENRYVIDDAKMSLIPWGIASILEHYRSIRIGV